MTLGSERVLSAVAGSVQPPHRARRSRRGQLVQHREHRGDSDADGQQDHGTVALGEEERAPGCRDVDQVAHREQ
jgi:hypothetical protein